VIAVSLRPCIRSAVCALTLFPLFASPRGPVGATSMQAQPAQVVFESNRGSGDANVILARDPVTPAPTEEIQPAFSPEGRLAFASDRKGNFDIFAKPRGTSGDPLPITTDKGQDYSPAWSAESVFLAFVTTRKGNADIYVIQAAEGVRATQVTRNRADDIDPTWAPHELRIAFASNRAGTYDIWIADLANPPTQVTDSPGADFEPSWSPDGHTLAFTRRTRGSGNYDIYTRDVQGGRPRRLTSDPAEDSEPSWSPDGTQIAFVSDRDGDYDIYVMNADGSNEESFSDNAALFDVAPNWKPPEGGSAGSVRVPALIPTRVGRRTAPTFSCGPRSGGPGNDVINGTPEKDYICGKGGNDIIYGRGGNDEISGGLGKDKIYGGYGNDEISGGLGKDKINGGYGNDIVDAREGRDRVRAGPGKDKLNSKDGSRDRLRGGNGIDRAHTDGRKLDKGRWEAKL
jgi:WD40-like Beta Propeller Repeat/RTX calcium-binding nonapeptide repeat (4 copies)